MDQNTRINKMEDKLNNVLNFINNYQNILDNYANIQNDINDLNYYLGSNIWFNDKNDFESGKIKNIRAGVLSEDSIYNMLEDNHDLAIQMLEIATKILKNK